jgi:predicted AlkP superfamily pyrophosphatase or phosphodiesterase
LSNHDFTGHHLGPNDPGMEKLTLEEDRDLAVFFNDLSKQLGGLQHVVIALTADHGVAPMAEWAREHGLNEANAIDAESLTKELEVHLSKKLGSGDWVLGSHLFHFFLNHKLAAEKKIPLARLEKMAKQILLADAGVETIVTRDEYENDRLPQNVIGKQAANDFVVGQSGDLILVPKPFVYQKKGKKGAVHMTGWNYDISVPLILFGRKFKAGVYSGAHVVDLAPTLSFVLGVLKPAASQGRVLQEVLK